MTASWSPRRSAAKLTMKAESLHAVDPDRLAELEAERSFLLRSLRDLDAEHAAGDVDENDYATLRDGYTKRAADVMRQIDAKRAALPAKQPTAWGRRVTVIAGVVAIAALAGWLVARSSGQRIPDQLASGGAAGADLAATLTQARMLLGSDPLQAIELYTDVLEQQPDHAEAHTYRGWLLYTGSRQASDARRAEAVDVARSELAEAIEADPNYADPHCFLAVIADDYDDDQETARTEADACLALDPPGEIRSLIAPFVAALPANATTP